MKQKILRRCNGVLFQKKRFYVPHSDAFVLKDEKEVVLRMTAYFVLMDKLKAWTPFRDREVVTHAAMCHSLYHLMIYALCCVFNNDMPVYWFESQNMHHGCKWQH